MRLLKDCATDIGRLDPRPPIMRRPPCRPRRQPCTPAHVSPRWSASSKRRVGLDLPLDVRGTAFQQRVWQALREIPAGATASYADIARRIGSPKAVRAVAQACAPTPSPWRSRAIASCAPTALFRLSLGRRAQARPARTRSRSMTALTEMPRAAADHGGPPRTRRSIGTRREGTRCAGLRHARGLLTPEECPALAALYPQDERSAAGS